MKTNANLVTILGIDFVNKSFHEVVEKLFTGIKSNCKAFIVTANPEIVMYAAAHPEYRDIVQAADMVVPDGSGIILASKILNEPIQERVTGYDLTIRLLELGDENKWRIYLLGGREEINKKAADNICNQFPNVELVGRHHGFFDSEKNNSIIKEIKASRPDIVFVALGFPRQEKWISKNLHHFSKGLFMGVGGSIDVLAGEAKRAPLFWRKMNLEWFYRLLMQPSRWKRMLALPRFLVQIIKVKINPK
ncbi:WecB/TagA/CpsF family glycosyltransferase [Neobacillus soli]|uniref:WecB/TagA/CpsF family glycosyltransferase n=1 Tax=Neobacillus soli TaxID=220688 RepID=UPI000824D110|nr:WecB/TagA/CpsF family glycosyltransferase [Neobacillus soli]